MTQPRNGGDMDTLWYKDAVIYEVHVKAFFDSNNDGIGDFRGLTERLDYLQDLGITCLWLLPFYPSPLRDDGYDIQNYRDVHAAYGTRRDFRNLVREAHARGIKVMTELVINHTSDQHPWFQVARHAPAGSSKRNFYVWSETPDRYREARVIFTDSETSNWTWDPVAQAYYWHRFFHHQPDLNFDNPLVRRAVARVMRFWLDLGVDGLRLDAVPYLIEREGTICENLPDTHEVLREIRRELDAHYTDRILIAEANQWPADVLPYFGNADECHMAFHFPLMPRIFMAVRQEDRHPITDILRQTPAPPATCQWGLFLRNHDEMTLEMVTDEERDYMYQAYAADPQMRLNLGIRRRLAPLLDNSRPRIELLNSLLFSLPGTPIVYYGDELGMGDNIYLGDRNGVRTPMQWTGDRNGGFSRADPAKLYAPPIMDPVYGYQAINVEAQERSPSSPLNWMRHLIALRKQYRTFGRGDLKFLYPANRKILAFLRRDEDHEILVVANLSRTMQPVELDLSAHEGLVPIELLGSTRLPPIAGRPYFLTLGPYAFYWLELRHESSVIAAQRPPPPPAAEVESIPVLMSGPTWETMLDGHMRVLLERDVLPAFLEQQRWFVGKARPLETVRITDWATVVPGRQPAFLSLLEVCYADGEHERYVLPLVATESTDGTLAKQEQSPQVIARISGARRGLLLDATLDDRLCLAIFDALKHSRELSMRHGRVRAHGGASLASTDERPKIVRRPIDQSNTSIVYGDRYILKMFRRIETGINPDLEIGRFLASHTDRARVPALMGALEYEDRDGELSTVGILQELVRGHTSGWEASLDELGRYFERAHARARAGHQIEPASIPLVALCSTDPPSVVEETIGAYLASIVALAQRTANLHLALAADPTDPAFAPEPLTEADCSTLADRLCAHANDVLELVARQYDRLPAAVAAKAQVLLQHRAHLLARFDALRRLDPRVVKTRVHGDYHLGQVLQVGGDFVIIDFEGEPARPLSERRTKQSPMKDVAGLLRSLSYAAQVGLRTLAEARLDDIPVLTPWARAWTTWTSAAFLRTYVRSVSHAGFVPADPESCGVLLDAFVLDKALYELRYEMNARPQWIDIPLEGLLSILSAQAGSTENPDESEGAAIDGSPS